MVNRVLPRHTAVWVAVFFFLLATIAIAQIQQPPEQLLYAVPGQTLPAGSNAAGYLLFNSLNPNVFPSWESAETYQLPALFVQKPSQQHGIFVIDNNSTDKASDHPLNIEVYNQTGSSSDGGLRGAVRVHVDPSVTAGQYFGIGIGNHGTNSWGLQAVTDGTQGFGIVSQSYGAISYFGVEGDENHASLGTIGMQFNHYATGSILNMYQAASAMTGDFVYGNAGYDPNKPGAFTGHFLNFNVRGSAVFQVNSDGTTVIPSIKAHSGTRFVCVDTTGRIISQTTPCSGT